MPASRRIPTTSPIIEDRRAAMSIRARTRTERPSGIRMVETATVKIMEVVHMELTGRNTDQTSRGLTAAVAAHPNVTEASPPLAARRRGQTRLIEHRRHLTHVRIRRAFGAIA